MASDPLGAAYQFADIKHSLGQAHLACVALVWCVWYKMTHSHTTIQYKGPDNPFARTRHKRFPGGAAAFGWGNNGLNRDCNLLEYNCWAGYTGKEYTY
jgi:hypothetical protein